FTEYGTPGIGQFPHDAIAYQTRQTLQGSHIGRHSHVDFLDREVGVGRAVAHVTRGNQVDSSTDTVTMDCRNHRLAALIYRIEGGLQLENVAADTLGVAADVGNHAAGSLREHLQVDARGKILAHPRNDRHSHAVGLVNPVEHLDHFGPEGFV